MTWWGWVLVLLAGSGGLVLGGVLGSNARSYLEDEVQHWRKRYMDVARDMEHA